jgi:uncharacterized membrane protein YphA (DoxX/SURF4 family)
MARRDGHDRSMRMVRFLVRPMLAGVFINGGIDTWRHPEPRADIAAPILERVVDLLPPPPPDHVTLVRANAALHVGAASMLAIGVMPRVAALTLAASLVPTTMGGH